VATFYEKQISQQCKRRVTGVRRLDVQLVVEHADPPDRRCGDEQ
jgi:hypothetical protein